MAQDKETKHLNRKIIGIESPAAELAQFSSDQESDLYMRISGDIQSAKELFLEKHKTGWRNTRFYMGDQWTDAEKLAHATQNRIPYVFNEIADKVNHMLGNFEQTRMDAKIMAREKGDENMAEIIGTVVKYLEQANNMEILDSEVALDGLIKGAGAYSVRWDAEGLPWSYPKIEKVPIEELYWDTKSRRSDLSDARWLARLMTVTRMDAVEILPEYEQLINEAPRIGNRFYHGIGEYGTPRLKKASRFDTITESAREEIEITEHYERVKIYEYIVFDEILDKQTTYTNKEEALAFAKGLVDAYMENDEVLTYPDGTHKVYVATAEDVQIVQTLLLGERVLNRMMTALPTFPYVVSFCNFLDGDYWAFVDNLISPQILINRSFSQYDYELGTTTKHMMTVVEAKLKGRQSIENIRAERSTLAPTFSVLSHDAIQMHSRPPVSPELFQSINHAMARMQDYAGGRAALGLGAPSIQSARGNQFLADAASMSRLPMFARLRQAKRQVIDLVVWYVKNFMDAGAILRIIGMEPNLKYRDLDSGVIDSMKELDYDVIVSEAQQSDSMRQQQFVEIAELIKSGYITPQVGGPLLIELSGLSETKKEQILKADEIWKQLQQQQAEAANQQKIQQQAKDMVERQSARDKLEKEQGIEEQQIQDSIQAEAKKAQMKQAFEMQTGQDLPGGLEGGQLAAMQGGGQGAPQGMPPQGMPQ